MGDRGIIGRATGDAGTARRATERPGVGDRGTGRRGLPAGPPPPRQLATVDEVEFADVIAGEVMTREVWIFNTNLNAEAELAIQIEVRRDRPDEIAPFQIVSAPSRLRPSREGPGQPVVIAFQCARRAEVEGTLIVGARWRGEGTPPESHAIRLRGWTRADGEPVRAEVAAAAADRERRDTEARREAERLAAMQRRYDQDTAAPPPAKDRELTREYELAKAALERVSDAQFGAIPVVQAEANKFRRRVAAPNSGVGAALASLALDIATAGIAKRVSVGVVKLFADRVKYTRPDPVRLRDAATGRWRTFVTEGPPKPVSIAALLSPEGLATLDEMVEATVSGTLRDLRAERAERTPGAAAPVSGEADLDFFSRQDDLVADRKKHRTDSLVNMFFLLKPFLRREADVAIAAMRGFHRSLDAEAVTAKQIQATLTRQAWMSFCSQGSVGSLSAAELRRRGLRILDDTVSVTDVARLAHAISGDAVPSYDGVLDLHVRASKHRPLEPSVIERVHMSGVTSQMLRSCLTDAGLGAGRARGRFGDLGVAMRVIVTAPGIETFGVVVTRDEAGNVFSSDTSGATPQSSDWLARRAGHRGTSPGKEHDGAVQLVAELLDRDVASRDASIHLSTDAG